MSILVSGGAGYIGSHTCIELMAAGYEILVADSLVNSSETSLARVKTITGKDIPFIKVDLCDANATDELFREHPEIDSVIHFAALKAVGESVQKPLEYYTNNLVNTLNVLNSMRKYGVSVGDSPLSRREWLQHAQEEALDLAVYLQRLIEMEGGA